MRVTLLALLCLRAVAEQSEATSSLVAHFGSLRTGSVDSAGEAEAIPTTSIDPVTGHDLNSVSNEDAFVNRETTLITSIYPITNTEATIINSESNMVSSTATIFYTGATIADSTSVTDTDFVTLTDSSSIINTVFNSISNSGVNTNTEGALTTDTDPVTSTDSTPVSTDAITNNVPISMTNTDLESTSNAERTAATSNPITLSSQESPFTTLSDLSTPSNTDPTEMRHESLTTIFSNRFTMINALVTTDPSKSSPTASTVQTFTTTADSFTTSSGLPTDGSSTTSTLLTTLGLKPSESSSISTSDTWLSTSTSSTTSFLAISSSSAESVAVSDIAVSGGITVGPTPSSSTTGTASDSPSVVVTDLLSTTSPSSHSTAITQSFTPINTESTSWDTEDPTAPPLSTTTTISTNSTAPSYPTESEDDRGWVFVYALAGAVAAVMLLLLGVLLCFRRRRQQSKPARTPGYEAAQGLPLEVDRFHDRLSYKNDGMSTVSSRSESLSSFQDYRRQTLPDQINSKLRSPKKTEQQNQISLYPQTRKDPSRDTIHLEVGNNQSYIHVTAALSPAISSWRSESVPNVQDLRRGYPNLPYGTRVQPRSVSRARREPALYSREEGPPHPAHPSRYSAWDDGYYPSTMRDHSGRQEHTSTGNMGEHGHEPRSCGLLKPIYLQGPSVVGKIPRARC